MPLMAPVVFLMGVGPLARWKQAVAARAGACACAGPPSSRWSRRWPAAGSPGASRVVATLGLLMGWWVVASVATDLWGRIRPRDGAGIAARAALLPRAVLGMMLAHLGMAVFIFGVTMVKGYEVERDVKMATGDTTTIEGYVFTFRGVREIDGPNYRAAQALVEVTQRRQQGGRHAAREARLPRAAQPDDRGGDPHRLHAATSTSRSASRSKAAPGSCASTSSPSSTGSGAAAC